MPEPETPEQLDGSTTEDQPLLPAGDTPPASETPPPKAPPKPRKKRRKRRSKSAAGDKPPKEKSGAQKRKENRSGEYAKVEEVFAKILTMPAAGMMMKGDAWAAGHFQVAGPGLAVELRKECEKNPVLHRYALQAAEWLSIVGLAGAIGAYTLPLLIHWNLIPGAEGLGPFMGVPVIVRDAPAPMPASPPPFMGGNDAPPPPPAPEPEPDPPPHDPGSAARAMADAMASNDAAGADPAASWEDAGFDPADPLAAELAGEGVPPPPVASL